MTSYNLTPADIELCDQFEALLKRIVDGNNHCTSVSAGWIDTRSGRISGFPSCSVQNEYRAYSAGDDRRSIAFAIKGSLAKFQEDNQSKSVQELKARRIAELKADLARLEQAA